MERIEQLFIRHSGQLRQSQMQESQRDNSDDLKLEEKGNAKGRREGDIDPEAVTGDGTSMSNDLMGSMDPDMFGGGGKKRAWRRRHDEDDAELGDDEDEGEAPLPSLADMLDLVPVSQRSLPSVSARAVEAEDPSDARVDPHRLELPSPAPPPVGAEEAPAASLAPHAATPQPPAPDRTDREARPAAPSAEVTAPTAEQELPTRSISLTESLLKGEEGYLIAGPGRRPRPRLMRPQAPSLLPLPPEVQTLVDAILVAPEPTPHVLRVQRTLGRFGVRLLSLCRLFGVRVLLVSDVPSRVVPSLAAHGDGQYDRCPAAYFAADKLGYLNLAAQEEADEYGDLAVLVFASAIDHAMGEDGFASSKSPMVLAGYQACQDNQPGHTFLDGFCAESPQHYFIHAVEAFMTQAGGPLRDDAGLDVYCSRARLYDLDRSVYSYVEYLLRDVRAAV